MEVISNYAKSAINENEEYIEYHYVLHHDIE